MVSRLAAVATTLVAAVLFPLHGTAQLSSNSTASWVTAGNVFAVARSGSTVFLGGQFDAIAPRHEQIGGFGLLLPASGQRACPVPPVNGPVYAIEPDGAGGFFVGGAFSEVGGVYNPGVAHVLLDYPRDVICGRRVVCRR